MATKRSQCHTYFIYKPRDRKNMATNIIIRIPADELLTLPPVKTHKTC